MTREEAITRIENAFRSLTNARDSSEYSTLLSSAVAAGKMYEAFVLAKVAEQLVTREGMELTLFNGNKIALKSSPGPINRRFPRIDAKRSGTTVAELWTDVEFLSWSYWSKVGKQPLTRGAYHELDIVMVDPGEVGRPSPDKIWLGIECKNTSYGKSFLREILGIRRELSLLQRVGQPTRFCSWPRFHVRADPPSCLAVFCADKRVLEYKFPGETFGIDFFHEELCV